MKISKLFHSLYALLMLAPVFAVAGSTIYTIVNESSVDSYSGSFAEEKVVAESPLDINVTYEYYSDRVSSLTSSIITFDITDFTLLETSDNGFYNWLIGKEVISLSLRNNSTSNAYFSFLTANSSVYFNMNLKTALINFTFKVVDITNFDSNFISYITYNKIYDFRYLDNSFEYSIYKMQHSPLFGWADTSFLAEPFSYIFGLFGIPSGSPFIMLLSYWLSISIIWLVFDLVMYVPLLIHGWIDKGGIE